MKDYEMLKLDEKIISLKNKKNPKDKTYKSWNLEIGNSVSGKGNGGIGGLRS